MNFAGPIDAKFQNDSPVSLDGDTFAFGLKPGFVQHHPSDAHVVVPDAHLLFSGNYVRIGNDLIISGADQKFVVGNYFKGEGRPTLTSRDGATLSGQIVDALTGHVVYAQAAAPAAAAQVIGHVLKLSGSASVLRNGVAVDLQIGDAVQKGDLVQTGSDTSIGLTFIDGSAFGMTSNARMVLNEMIYDPNGSSNSSLISLVHGTITFVAGQTAKNGNMRVETPVATMGIRGTAVLVEISANDGPTKFSVLAEPDGHTGSFNLYDKTTGQLIGTVSQAGQVTFVSSLGVGQASTAVEQLKTLADQQNEKFIIQQVFQLYFPNYTPDDAKPNSPKSNPRTDIGVPENNIGKYAFDPVTGRLSYTVITPITNPDTHQTTDTRVVFYNIKAAFSTTALTAKEASPGDASTSGVLKLTDAVHIDDPDINVGPFFDVATPFVANTGVLTAASTTATLTPAAKAALHLDSLLTINQTTGDVSFNRADFNFLAAGEKVEYVIRVTASSGPDSADVFVKVTITGENDAPTIETAATVATGGVTEDSVPLANNLEACGAIGFQDFDLTDAHTASFVFKSAASSAHLPGFVDGAVGVVAGVTDIGSFSLSAVSEILTDVANTGQVGWHFVLPDNDPVLQSLAVGQTITLVYTVTITDSSGVSVLQDVEITITGANDAPTIVGSTNDHPALTEDGTLSASGVITFKDVDLTDGHLVTQELTAGSINSTLPGFDPAHDHLGTLTLTKSESTTDTVNIGTVSWTFAANNALLQQLAVGQVVTQTYTVTINDQHGGTATQTIVITITGRNDDDNDDPVIVGSTNDHPYLTEDGTLSANGVITFKDVDLTDGHLVTKALTAGTISSVLPGFDPAHDSLGTLTLTKYESTTDTINTGTVSWNFAANNALLQQLAVGQVVTQTYTVTIDDEHGGTPATQSIVVTITGANDAPVIDVIAATPLNEQTDTSALTLASPIHVTFTDVDLIDVGHTASITAVAKAGVTSGLTLDDTALKALVTPGTVAKAAGSSSGSVDLGFSAVSTAFDYLAAGETLKLTYTLAIDDGNGGITPKDFEITITGTNDAPVIGTAMLAGAVTEDATLPAQTGSETAIGTIAFSDVDLTDGHTVTSAFKSTDYSGQLGSLTAVKTTDTSNGVGGLITWTFIVADTAMNELAQGQIVHETYTVTLDDGHGSIITRDVVITITGANDAPTVDAALTLTTTEGNAPIVKDLLEGASDVDNGDVLSVTNLRYSIDGGPETSTAPGGITFPDAHSINVDGANPAFDHLAAGVTQTILVSYDVEDVNHATVSQTETITVTGVNDRPVLAAGADLATITEDQTTNSGQLVSSFATGISDADDGALKGVAITGYTSQNGHWEYSINNGTSWSTFGAYSSSSALLLAGDDKVRFVPDGDHGGSNTLTYVAWDQTSAATHGQTADTPSGLHSDAFSQGSQTATLTVTDINDAPVLDVMNHYVTEGFTPGPAPTVSSTIHDLIASDVDAGTQPLTLTATAQHGTLSLAGSHSGLTVTGEGTSSLSVSGLLNDLNATLTGIANGVTYTSGVNDAFVEQVKAVLNDGHGGSDTVNFIFPQNGSTAATLTGTSGKDVISSNYGSDIMTGGAGTDIFVFKTIMGNDTITDFHQSEDLIAIASGTFANFADLLAHTVTSGSDAVISSPAGGSHSLTIAGVDKAHLTAADFHLA